MKNNFKNCHSFLVIQFLRTASRFRANSLWNCHVPKLFLLYPNTTQPISTKNISISNLNISTERHPRWSDSIFISIRHIVNNVKKIWDAEMIVWQKTFLVLCQWAVYTSRAIPVPTGIFDTSWIFGFLRRQKSGCCFKGKSPMGQVFLLSMLCSWITGEGK